MLSDILLFFVLLVDRIFYYSDKLSFICKRQLHSLKYSIIFQLFKKEFNQIINHKLKSYNDIELRLLISEILTNC